MDFVQILILSIIQGITEFLPISSQSHLILTSRLLGMSDQCLSFDIALHTGSLIAKLKPWSLIPNNFEVRIKCD